MIGDTDYQVTDLQGRVKALENQMRTVTPGNAPSFGPAQALRATTSEGQLIPGADSDLNSRITSAIQGGLTDLESVQDVNLAQKSVTFGGGTTQILQQTNYLRPDPIVGDTYRVYAGGYFANNTGGSASIALGWALAATATSLGGQTIAIPNTQFIAWWLLALATVITAGASGTYLLNQRWSFSAASIAVGGGTVTSDTIANGTVSANLVAPAPTITAIGTTPSANLQAVLNQYSLERLGAGFASKV